MMTLVLILIAIVWSVWLFSGISLSKSLKHKLGMLAFWVVASSAAAVGYYYLLGSDSKIKSLVASHQELQSLSLLELSQKVEAEEIDLEQLLAELRLRSEIKPEDTQQWLQLGNIFLQFEQYPQAEQAYQRAINLKQDEQLRLQVARSYMDHGTKPAQQSAQEHIMLVLLNKPQHEGALLLQGINFFQQALYPQAINSWQSLLSYRNDDGEGAQIIRQQIDLAKQKIAEIEKNRIVLLAENLENIPLRTFTKAFALVRPAAGGTPIAVKSIELDELNKPIYITPENIMLATTDLWQVTDITVEIRLSQSGFAKPEKGDLYGRSPVLEQLKQGQQLKISLENYVN